jgi:hypothetical protein
MRVSMPGMPFGMWRNVDSSPPRLLALGRVDT